MKQPMDLVQLYPILTTIEREVSEVATQIRTGGNANQTQFLLRTTLDRVIRDLQEIHTRLQPKVSRAERREVNKVKAAMRKATKRKAAA